MNKDIRIIRRWMKYVDITLDDLGIKTKLENLSELWIRHLLELAEEDRARLISDGCFIREDWTEAT